MEVTVGKQHRTPLHLLIKDTNSEDLSDQDLREKMLWLFKELKEYMKWATHKTSEDMKIKMRKLQEKYQGWKHSKWNKKKRKNSPKSLTSRITAEDRISEAEDKLHNTSIQQKKL